MKVGLLFHPLVPASRQMAERLRALVESCGHEAWLESAWEREQIVAQAEDCPLIVTLGGDGTILRVVRATLGAGGSERCTPLLLTVDYGTLGFLAELAPAQAEEGVRAVLQGEGYWVEERALLRARLVRGDRVLAERDALNDVVLARGDGPHAIRLQLWIDGALVARYTADAMIIATPTGSTAYAQGAGGPIVDPHVPAMLAVPVAPHFAIARSFVVPLDSEIRLCATARRSTVVTVDGQLNLEYEAGDNLFVRRSPSVARFVRLGARNYFYATFQERVSRV